MNESNRNAYRNLLSNLFIYHYLIYFIFKKKLIKCIELFYFAIKKN